MRVKGTGSVFFWVASVKFLGEERIPVSTRRTRANCARVCESELTMPMSVDSCWKRSTRAAGLYSEISKSVGYYNKKSRGALSAS